MQIVLKKKTIKLFSEPSLSHLRCDSGPVLGVEVEGEEPVHLGHRDPGVDVDPGVEGEPLDAGARHGAGQLLDGPDETEDRDVGQSVEFKYMKRLQIMTVSSVDLDCHTAVQTGHGQAHHQRSRVLQSPAGNILLRLRPREVDEHC